MVFGGHCPKGPGESFMGRGCIRPMRCHETLVFLPSHTFTAHCCVLFLQKDETAAATVGKKDITFTLVGSIDSEYWKYLPLTIKLAKYAAPAFRIPLLGLRGRRLQKSVVFAAVTPLSLTTTAAPSCCCCCKS